ncbi:MAG: hypothetical protein ACRC7O_17340 [Fimbriiglobus sp.]
MKTVNIFYQGEGIREIDHIEADGDHTFAAIKLQVIKKHGLSADVLLFLEDEDEPVGELLIVRDHARPSGIKVHLHRCRHVEVHVAFNGETVHHRFGPGATVARVKRWAAERKFGMSESEASEHVLQIAGSHDRPTPGTHLGTLVTCNGCRLAFDLVPDQRVNGFTDARV